MTLATKPNQDAIDNARAKLADITILLDRIDAAQTANNAASYDNIAAAEEELFEMPLDVAVRSGWEPVGGYLKPSEYMILLTTGGPACRITGDLASNGEPENAVLEWQDWGTPWTPCALSAPERDALLRFAALFFG